MQVDSIGRRDEKGIKPFRWFYLILFKMVESSTWSSIYW